MKKMHCPSCDKPFDPAQSAVMPFCCARCKLMDLGRWLNEEIRFPLEPEDIETEILPQHADEAAD